MSVLALVLVLQTAASPAASAGADLPVIVHLADRTSLPLWKLEFPAKE